MEKCLGRLGGEDRERLRSMREAPGGVKKKARSRKRSPVFSNLGPGCDPGPGREEL